MDRSLTQLASAFPGRTVLILGDVMLDEYIWGKVRRISPEAPVPVVEIVRRSYTPGGAGNVSANVTSLDGRVMLGGIIGSDAAGERLQHELTMRGVETTGLLTVNDRPTTTKTRIVAHNQQIARLDTEVRFPLPPGDEDGLLAWAARTIPDVDVCVLSDYAKGVISPSLAHDFIQLARDSDKPVLVDPKATDYHRYRGVTLITPNLNEAMQAAGFEINGHNDLLSAARRLQELLDGSALLVTRGEDGMSLFEDGKFPLHIPAQARQVFDVTGAGDTALAVLALALGVGASLPDAAYLANLAAGIVVGKVGTASITCQELLAALDKSFSVQSQFESTV